MEFLELFLPVCVLLLITHTGIQFHYNYYNRGENYMKHHLPTFFRTFFVSLLICLLCFSQISSADINQSTIIRATELTDNDSTTNNSDGTIPDNSSISDTDINVNDTINTDDGTNSGDASDNSDSSSVTTPATNGSIKATPAPAKKPPKKTVKKVYFANSSVKLWPLQSTYNPVIIQEKGAKYSKITWSVSNTAYAKISSNGTVTLRKDGAGKMVTVTATVYYKKNGSTRTKSASYTVYGQEPVRNLKISNTRNFVFLGKRLILKASCIPNSASCQKILWSSSNKAYATISQRGIVHPKKAGTGKTVTFTAATTDGSMITKSIKVRIINPKKPMVALTFDDGPAPAYTTKIVNELEKFDAHATFFVLGSRLTGQNAKSIIRKAAKNGNEIGSHTYNHKKLTTLSSADIQQEASRTEKAIKQLTGSYPSLTRPPYGSINDAVKKNISTPLILWSIDTQDWKTKNRTNTVTTVLNNVKDGDIILMHDIYAPTADAAVELIPKLIQKGYQLVTVSELAAYKNQKLKSGNSYCNIKSNMP